MPFITEALWQRLPGHVDGEWLARAAWPAARGQTGGETFELARAAVSLARELRAEYAIQPGPLVRAIIAPASGDGAPYTAQHELIARLARLELQVGGAKPSEIAANAILPDGAELFLLLGGAIDVAKECARFQEELAQVEKQLGGLESRLANEAFLAKAKAEIIAGERQKQAEYTARRDALRKKVGALCG
jgi:valyl-tRNA synthetase